MRQALLLAVSLMIGLVACAPEAPPPPAPKSFRDTTVAIGWFPRFEAARFAGEWRVVSRFAWPEDPVGTAPESLTITSTGSKWRVLHRFQDCEAGGDCFVLEEDKSVAIPGPGRFVMPRPGGIAEHWVLWVDTGYRTAVIGSPAGTFGWVMERGPGSGDRTKAARDILDFYGYDMSLLRRVAR